MMPAWPSPGLDWARRLLWVVAAAVWTGVLAVVMVMPARAGNGDWLAVADNAGAVLAASPAFSTVACRRYAFERYSGTSSFRGFATAYFETPCDGYVPVEVKCHAADARWVRTLVGSPSAALAGSVLGGVCLVSAPWVAVGTAAGEYGPVIIAVEDAASAAAAGQVEVLAGLQNVVFQSESGASEVVGAVQAVELAAVAGAASSEAGAQAIEALFWAALAVVGFFGYSVGARDV